MKVILSVATIICGINWFKRYISCVALIYYMKKRGYKLPDDEEIKECTQYAVTHFLK